MRRLALQHGAYAAELNTAFEQGGKGATALAEAVVAAADEPTDFRFAYAYDAPIEEKIRAIARDVYGGGRRVPPEDGEGQGGAVRGRRPRKAPDLHGEDAPLALARCEPAERADRVYGDRPGPAPLHRRGVDRRALRRHADDAGPGQVAGRLRHRHRRPRQHRRAVLLRALYVSDFLPTPASFAQSRCRTKVRHRHEPTPLAQSNGMEQYLDLLRRASTRAPARTTAPGPGRSPSSVTRCGSTSTTASRS